MMKPLPLVLPSQVCPKWRTLMFTTAGDTCMPYNNAHHSIARDTCMPYSDAHHTNAGDTCMPYSDVHHSTAGDTCMPRGYAPPNERLHEISLIWFIAALTQGIRACVQNLHLGPSPNARLSNYPCEFVAVLTQGMCARSDVHHARSSIQLVASCHKASGCLPIEQCNIQLFTRYGSPPAFAAARALGCQVFRAAAPQMLVPICGVHSCIWRCA